MGGSVSNVVSSIANPTGLVGSIASPTSSLVSSVLGPIGGAIGGVAGSAMGGVMSGMAEGITSGINALGLNVTPADISKLQEAYVAAGGNMQTFGQVFSTLQHQAAQQLENTQNSLNQATTATYGLQGSALNMANQMAQGSAPAQAIARAQLQQGTDQAIHSQMAMANSGNLSQMIGGQKEAMSNAANLQQQSANQAAQNLASQQIAGMQQYGQQANAATTAAQNLASQQANLYGTQLGTSTSVGGLANTAQGNQINAATNAANLQEAANEATAKYKAAAASGLINSLGSVVSGAATGAGMASDKDLKKDIKSDKPMIEAFLDKLDAKSYEYKNPDGLHGKTKGKHIGIIAQEVEKAPGGESMVIELPEGKGIDIPSAVGMLMAAASNSHDRIKDLEEFFKTRKDRG